MAPTLLDLPNELIDSIAESLAPVELELAEGKRPDTNLVEYSSKIYSSGIESRLTIVQVNSMRRLRTMNSNANLSRQQRAPLVKTFTASL